MSDAVEGGGIGITGMLQSTEPVGRSVDGREGTEVAGTETDTLYLMHRCVEDALGTLALQCLAICIVCSCSLAVTFLINNIILKNIIARTRPYEVVEGLNRIIGAQSDFSFPSGHSGASFAVAVVMFMEMPKKYGVPALIVATLIAFSRLYVGVHYPFDVIAGVLTGTIYAVITVAIYRKFFKDKKHSEK